MKILIMGLPGSGKTYLAERMQPILNSAWYNADKVREMANDWDFSPEGRIRQSLRMKSLADFEKSQGRIVICDFVCPTKETKENFDPYGRTGMLVAEACQKNGLIVRAIGDVIAICPPLVITEQQIDELFDILEASIEEVFKKN